MSSDLHEPARPDWLCRLCSNPFPCSGYQEALLRRHTQSDGAVDWVRIENTMCRHFASAAGDMPNAICGPLHHRFITWVRLARNRTTAAANVARFTQARTSGTR